MLFSCLGYKDIRTKFSNRILMSRALESDPLELILKQNLNTNRIKDLGYYLEEIMDMRINLLYEDFFEEYEDAYVEALMDPELIF